MLEFERDKEQYNVLLSNAVYELLYHIVTRNAELYASLLPLIARDPSKRIRIDYKLLASLLSRHAEFSGSIRNYYVKSVLEIAEQN